MTATLNSVARAAPCLSLLQSLSWITARRCFASSAVNTTSLVKQLREQSGAPISDVKSCLQQAGWDVTRALELLKQKGLAAAAKKSSRSAAEGLVGISVLPKVVAVVEVNSETDFVARNSGFVGLVQGIANAVARSAQNGQISVEKVVLDSGVVQGLQMNSGVTVADACAQYAAQVRENVLVRRAYCMQSNGILGSYIHAGDAKGVGRIAAVLELEAGEAAEHATGLQQIANDLAMHVAGMNPSFVDSSTVPLDYMAVKKDKLAEEASAEGKAGKVLQQIVQGRLNKHLQEVCLLRQPWILDDSKTVQEALNLVSQHHLRVVRFWRVERGEGLVVNSKNLASEVAELLNVK